MSSIMVVIPRRFEIDLNGGDVFFIVVVFIIIIIIIIIIVVQLLPLLGLCNEFFINL